MAAIGFLEAEFLTDILRDREVEGMYSDTGGGKG